MIALPFRLVPRAQPSKRMRVLAPLIAVGLTLLAGLAVFALLGHSPWEGFRVFFVEPLSDINGWSELVLKASPLCLIALGLAIGFRANVWNIGAEGQLIVGAIVGGGVGLYFDQTQGVWLLPLMLSTTVGVFSKESAVVIVGIIVLHELCGRTDDRLLSSVFLAPAARATP